jgi:hypothetical protein
MAKSGSPKLWLTILVVAALVGGGYYYFVTSNAPKPAQFITTKITRTTLTQTVTATGDLQPVSTVEVGCQISGFKFCDGFTCAHYAPDNFMTGYHRVKCSTPFIAYLM